MITGDVPIMELGARITRKYLQNPLDYVDKPGHDLCKDTFCFSARKMEDRDLVR